ncbi:MAG: hypothetical protein ACE5HC_14575 [Candidatus Binatia bacterium]
MQKGLIALVVMIFLLGLGGSGMAQQGTRNPCAGQHKMGMGQANPQGQQDTGMSMMGPGTAMMGMMNRGTHGHMGSGRHMMGMMGPGMGMAGGMMRSPEIMGTMMSIHGETLSLMGRMMQRYGTKLSEMTPELRGKMRKEIMEGLGGILSKAGAALKEKAKTVGK